MSIFKHRGSVQIHHFEKVKTFGDYVWNFLQFAAGVIVVLAIIGAVVG